MNPQYFPRGPAPMMRERELAENCLRQMLQSPEIQRDRVLFQKYMEQITNEILGIQNEKIRKEQEVAARKAAALQQQQVRQTITDDMRMASTTSLDKLRNLRESMRDSSAGGNSMLIRNQVAPSQYVLHEHSHAYAPSYHFGESAQPYFADQQFQQHQSTFHSDYQQPQHRERGHSNLSQSDYFHTQSYQPPTQLPTPPSAQEYTQKFFPAENNADHQLHVSFSHMEQSNASRHGTQISSPPKSAPLPSSSQSDLVGTSSYSEYLPTSSGKQLMQPPQSNQLKAPAQSHGSANPNTISGYPAKPTAAPVNGPPIPTAKLSNAHPSSSWQVAGNTPMPTQSPSSKPAAAAGSANNTNTTTDKLSLSHAIIQQQQQVQNSSNTSSTEPSPQNQLSTQGGNPAATTSNSQRRRFSIGEEDWDEEGSAFTPTSHKKTVVKASPARRPSTDLSPGKTQGISAQSPTLVKPPTISLERPLSASKPRSSNTATVLATTTASTPNAKEVSYNTTNISATGVTRNVRALSNASSDVQAASAAVSNNARSASPVPILLSRPTAAQNSEKEPAVATKSLENKAESSDEELSDLEDIDGDDHDIHSEMTRSMTSEKVQPPLSSAMMASVIHNNHPISSSANKGSTGQEAQSKAHVIPLHHPAVPRPLSPRGGHYSVGVTTNNNSGTSQEKMNGITMENVSEDVEEDEDVDLSWGNLKKMQKNVTEKKNSSAINDDASEAAILPNFPHHSGRTLVTESQLTAKEEERIVAAEYARLKHEMNTLKLRFSGSRLPSVLSTAEHATSNLPPLYTERDYAAFTAANKIQGANNQDRQLVHNNDKNNKSNSSVNPTNNSGKRKNEIKAHPAPSHATNDTLRGSIDLSGLSLQRIRELTGHY